MTELQPLPATPRPAESGSLDVNGVHMYYETYGAGTPLVLLHGGMLSIRLNFAGLIPTLAKSHRVLGAEIRGPGPPADIQREITPAGLASDIVGLLDHLGIDRAHVLGHSMGAAVAIELAISYPDRVRSVVPISVSVRPDGMHEDLSDPSKFATSPIMPTQEDFAEFRGEYERLSPHPEHFEEFLGTLSASNADLKGWSDGQLPDITAPTLLVLGDRDFTPNGEGALMQRPTPGSQLAILPNTTHMQVTRRANLLLPMLEDFLD